MHDLIDRAVKAGLKLADCACCGGREEIEIETYPAPYGGKWEFTYPCPACNGTGQDRTPWAVFGAVVAWTLANDRHLLLHDNHVSIFRRGFQWFNTEALTGSCKHDGTPESIARAALTAWLRTRGEEA